MARRPTKRPARAQTDAPLEHPDLGPVEQVPIDRLKPYDKNARTHDDRQIAKIAASLQAFGWMNPILVGTGDTIIAGHGRWMAAKSLGLETCPVIRAEHLTPDAERAYRLADNRLAELAGWDRDTLEIELQHLSDVDLDFDLETIGWDYPEIDLLLDPEKEEEGDPADATVSPPAAVAVSRLGDHWQLGQHHLLCGSALDEDAFDRLMHGQKAAMVFIDAPYNKRIVGHVGGLGQIQHREFAMASGEMSELEFREFLALNAKLLAAHAQDGAIIEMCMDWGGLLSLQLAIADAGLSLINLAVWVKNNGGMGSLLRSQHELVLITKKGSAPHINNVQLGKHGRYRTNVWRYAGVNSFGRGRMDLLSGHPTPKPIAMVADAIRDVSHRGQIVLDSFMGSGTTLLAAERTKRIAYGMDIDPLYVDLTVRRWEAMTGQQAVLLETGQSFTVVADERSPRGD